MSIGNALMLALPAGSQAVEGRVVDRLIKLDNPARLSRVVEEISGPLGRQLLGLDIDRDRLYRAEATVGVHRVRHPQEDNAGRVKRDLLGADLVDISLDELRPVGNRRDSVRSNRPHLFRYSARIPQNDPVGLAGQVEVLLECLDKLSLCVERVDRFP